MRTAPCKAAGLLALALVLMFSGKPVGASEIAPMSIDVSWVPNNPTTADETTFVVTVDDLDGRVTRIQVAFGRGEGILETHYLCVAPIVPYHETWLFPHHYANPGTYTITVEVDSGPCMPFLTEERSITRRVTIG